MTRLGGLTAHKAPPGRHAVEQIAHLDHSAARMGRRPHCLKPAGVDQQFMTLRVDGAARQQSQPRDRTDGRQCFTAKTEAGDLLQIIEAGDLAGGMTGDGQRQFVG